MTNVILDDKISKKIKAIGLLLIIPTVLPFAFVKFMNKTKSIGSITFNKNNFAMEVSGLIKELNYNSIDKIHFVNYNG